VNERIWILRTFVANADGAMHLFPGLASDGQTARQSSHLHTREFRYNARRGLVDFSTM